MRITFGQACEELAGSTNAYGADDVKKSINKALRALVRLHPLRCFRQILRFTSAGPEFVLPQGCAGLVRACVNGRPVTMRGQDFRFYLSGPGDMNRPPFRAVPPDNIISIGPTPVIVEPKHPFQIFAVIDEDSAEPSLTVRGLSINGDEIVSRPVPTVRESGLHEPEVEVFRVITSVTLDKCATKYVTLYAVDAQDGRTFAISRYNPRVLVPSFMRYEIAGLPPDTPVEILAEVRMDHVDLVDDSDVLPIENTQPIEYMIRADFEMKAGETQRADVYRKKAEEWLRREESTTDTVQTKITINSSYYGSPGEISDEAANI